MKIAVLFPGIGYHCDKPLLYYAGKLAAQHGFGEVVRVSYTFDGGNIRGNAAAMRAAFDALYDQAVRALSDVNWNQYEEILFVSKSIGTCVAAAYAERNGLAARHILYTPLKETFQLAPKTAIAFIGTADPWSDAEEIRRLCMDSGIPLTVIPDANHSLETGNALQDIEILRDVMSETLKYIASPAFRA